jgi:predicted dehydrogenase
VTIRRNDPALRAVVLGAGLMGRWHAAAISSAGGKLVAAVDPVLERAKVLAGKADTFASLEELARTGPSIDIVHVCTPLGTHSELVRGALELGANVVVEKPVAPDAATTSALLSDAAKRGLLLVPVHQFLFQAGVQRLLAKRQTFGPLVRCAFDTSTAGAEKTGLDPDELVGEILPHPLALFAAFADVALAELTWLVVRPSPGELRAVAQAQGASFEIVISTRGRPTRAGLEVVGTLATGHADLFHGFAVVERGKATRVGKATRPFALAGRTLAQATGNLAVRAVQRETGYPGLRELVRTTYDAIRRGSPAPISAAQTLDVAHARDRVLASGADERR